MTNAPQSTYSHAPSDYKCPFCGIAEGAEDARNIVWRDASCMAFLALHQHPRNAGALLICPVSHFENLYVLPDALGAHIFRVTKRLALALKTALSCDGVSTRQHNEPAGNQDVWHYHVHLIPRFANDGFGAERAQVMPLEQRLVFAESVRRALGEAASSLGTGLTTSTRGFRRAPLPTP